MNADELRSRQAPIKARCKEDPASSRAILRAGGTLDFERLTCRVETGATGGAVEAGLHALTGGDGTAACSGDMLLQALVGCAGVTLTAVACALGIEARAGRIEAEGDLDFRGTLGVARDVPVGFSEIRLRVTLDTQAEPETLRKLLELTERSCVVFQTLRASPTLSATIESREPGE
jgi:uncharacterized OsmC-like protein